MKACPYCAEPIQDTAIFCKFCRSWLSEADASSRSPAAAAAPVALAEAAALPTRPATLGRAAVRDPPRRVSRGTVGAGIGWMVLISLLLGWLPLLGPFVAGLVGGKKAGGVANALAAVFLPGILFGALLFAAASALTGLPLVGALAGAGGVVLAFAHVGPLLLGAIIGGLMA